MIDFKLIETGSGGSIQIVGNDAAILQGWGNMIYLAWFGGNRVSTPTRRASNEQALDWWGNSFIDDPAVQFNSQTEWVLQRVPLNSDGRLQIERAATADLEFMKPFANVSVEVEIPGLDQVRITARITQPTNPENKEFIFIWDGTKSDLSADIQGSGMVSDSVSFPQCPAAAILLNGTPFTSVPSGGSKDIPVVNTLDIPVGSKVDDKWVVPAGPDPSGIVFQRPNPSQITSYRSRDEGSRIASGWYAYTPPSYPKVYAQLDDSASHPHFTLKSPLIVGGISSTRRFTDVRGGQSFGAANNIQDVVIDKLSGYMFTRMQPVIGNWNDLIDGSATFSVIVDGVTYTGDWYLITENEAMNLFNGRCTSGKMTDADTSVIVWNGGDDNNFTATTTAFSTTDAVRYVCNLNIMDYQAKTTAGKRAIYVRKCDNLITAP